MSEQIDWSKAPADATHYLPEDGDNHECWLKPGFAVRLDRNSHDWFDDFSTHRKIEEGLAIPRPTTPSWSGEGLPPVGVVCGRCYCSPGEYYNVRILAHDPDCGEIVIYRWVDGPLEGELDQSTMHLNMASGSNAHWSFRPIRTPEQIATDEREAACEEMLEIAKSRRHDPDLYEAIATIYDAGYRKEQK